jgi:hypothetical protein
MVAVFRAVPAAGIWLPWPSQAIAVMSLTAISLTGLSRLLLVQQSDH